VYPTKNFDEKHDPYSEGYIVHYNSNHRKNVIKVGFPKPVSAKQVVIGGIFNIGSISAISVFSVDGKEKVVYTLEQKSSKTKFNTFSVFFPLSQVVSVKIILDHSKINEWNLLKGVGLTNYDQAIELKPSPILATGDITEKEKVGTGISSKDCYEFSPKLSPDGRTLYFVKECPDNANSDQDIWYSEIGENKQWTEAKPANGPLNNKGHNFVASIGVDGNFLILGNTYNSDGSDAGDGVSISRRKTDGNWDVPVAIKIPNYENQNDHANYFMSSDESVMLMAIQDSKSYGELDLYVTFYDKYKKTWSASINLGQMINTPFSEDYPYLAPDGQTMYFSSKGYLGYGGHDIYMSKRLDDTWKKWTKPINLGPMVNSKADDKGFAITSSGDHAYYNTVNFDSDLHHMDIYKINLPKILHQNPQVLMSGYLFDDKNQTTIRGTVRVKLKNGELVAFCTSNQKSGKYALSVPYGKEYDLQIDAINFFQVNEKLNLTDSTIGVDIMKNFILNSYLDSGQTIVLKDILFEPKSVKLLPNANLELDKIIDQLIQQSNSNIEICGYTDNVGKPEDNKRLSLLRARAVGEYFTSKGIRELRLTYKGSGQDNPIADNKTTEGRALNRRVVIKYMTKLTKQ